ncbi:MAG: dTDP-4-dehydrorhamnose reductase [Mariprofundaceae bacterium]
MRLFITGASGQVGSCLCGQARARGHEMHTFTHAELDVSDARSVTTVMARVKPDVVINAAAFTAVDRAEQEKRRAFAVNHDGAAHLARTCQDAATPLIHISTDYVFDGSKQSAYVEDDPIAPLGVYGESKAAGEAAVRDTCDTHIILRTAWVFSATGQNFVRTILKLAGERDRLRVVSDQTGCPTYAGDIAGAILDMLPRLGQGKWGTYHYCGTPAVSWHGFAEAIVDEARPFMSVKVQKVEAIATKDYPTPTRRPVNSVLDCSRIEATFGIRSGDWRAALPAVIRVLSQ